MCKTTLYFTTIGQVDKFVISTTLTWYIIGQDQLPPARVHDVDVIETISKNKSVILKWTAPGNDMDKGTGILIICESKDNSIFVIFVLKVDLSLF